MDSSSRPQVRPVEWIIVADRQYGRALQLRDTQGVTDQVTIIPPPLIPIVTRFTGRLSCQEVATAASSELGFDVPVASVVRFAEELELGLLLEGAAFREARARVEAEFSRAAIRPAAHAGGAYHGDRRALAQYIERGCFAKAHGAAGHTQGRASATDPRMVALVAPHIDPWRGALGYGHAYGALAAALPPAADTFVLFGTSHAPMRQPFALCRKAFATPLGTVEADLDGIDMLAACARGFDPYADQINHKREHSIEFQAVFLKHVLGARAARIVPVLAGLGEQQASGDDPGDDARVMAFIDGVRSLVTSRPGRVVLVAGADLAHVGPRFGDRRPLGAEERGHLEGIDRTSLERATGLDSSAFWHHVASDLDSRRVCGLAPIWSLVRSLSGAERGELLHYEQTIDKDDGSIVSHAAVGFYG